MTLFFTINYLIDLFVTLIVLLILAGISLSGLFSEKGLFKRTEEAGNRYSEAKAREVLETVLLTDGQYEKNTNPEYNQDDFLDALIKSEIPGSDVKGDVAIIGDYAYELDRSVPKIGRYLGNPEDLIFPAVTVAEITHADPEDNYRTAKIEITVTINPKAENGINRIEIWQNGIKLSHTIECNNEKAVTTEYKANKNGVYIIKAYSDLMGSAKTTVMGIVPAVEFLPNGNTEWKKEHTTKITVKETEDDKITRMKYLWKKSSEAEPQTTDFTENCVNNSTIIVQGETMTGKYCLWVLVTLGTGENERTYISGSEEFYFDNEGPTITAFTAEKYSENGITYNVTAKDEKAGIVKVEFYIDNVIQNEYTKIYTATTSSVTINENITGINTGSHKCKIIVYDALDNFNEEEKDGTTKLYTWNKWNVIYDTTHEQVFVGQKTCTYGSGGDLNIKVWLYMSVEFDKASGLFKDTGPYGASGQLWDLFRSDCSYADAVPFTTPNRWFHKVRGVNTTKKPSSDNSNLILVYNEYKVETKRTPKQGSSNLGYEYGNTRDRFEENKQNGNYWYTWVGIT